MVFFCLKAGRKGRFLSEAVLGFLFLRQMVDMETNIRLIFGLKLKELRTQQKLSFAQLSEVTGLSVSYLNEIEKGKKYPKQDKILILCNALNTEYDELVSLKLNPKLAPINELLTNGFLDNIQLDVFGLSKQKLVEMVAKAPSRVSAFISTLIKTAKTNNLGTENFYFASLRSYQELHNNYFEEIEDQVDEFLEQFEIDPEPPIAEAELEDLLVQHYNYQIDDTVLGDDPVLSEFRCIYLKTQKKLLVNHHLSSRQRCFLFAKEIAFNFMKLKERPYRFSLFNVDSFEKALNNFKASYFAVALLLNRHLFLQDLSRDLDNEKWHENKFLDLMNKYNATPEMFLSRLTNLLPSQFGISRLFFHRVHHVVGSNSFQINKELNMDHSLTVHTLENEHYCRRWEAIGVLQELDEQLKQGITSATPVRVQRRHYLDTGDEFLTLSIARTMSPTPNETVSVTIGAILDDQLKEAMPFWKDPAIKRVDVHRSCERCSLTDCAQRAAKPILLDKLRYQEKIELALAELISKQ